jgi:hypothetical protein
MAWVRPSRSRAGQKGGVAGKSGGAGGSSSAGGGPTALGGGNTGLGRSRGATAPRDQCHQPALIVTGPCCRMGFRWLLLRPTWKSRNVLLLGAHSLTKPSSARRKSSWLPSAPARTLSMSRPAWAMAGTRRRWREPAEVRRGRWLHRRGGNEPGLQRSPSALAEFLARLRLVLLASKAMAALRLAAG